MARIAPFAFLLVAAFRCHGDSKSGTPTNGAAATSGSPGASASNAASAALPPDDIFHKDPCRYVSQAETEAYLGPLLHTPYRGTDDRITADSNGRFCLYRGKDGRSIVVSAEWLDGAKEMKQYTQGFLSKIFVDDKGKTDTLSDVWDEAAIRDGTLFALKADTMFAIAYGASKADLVGATKLAEDAIGRLGKPLAYNGATAAAGVPGPLVAARDACTVLTRKEVEAVMGPLTADPTSEGTVCHYPTSLGMINLTVAWTGGFQAIFSDRGAMNNAHAMIPMR
jgi:hypothetical protein